MPYTLSEADFLDLLQSVTQTCIANTRLTSFWKNNFSELTWSELIEPEQAPQIHFAYTNMFSLALPMLNMQATTKEFAALAYHLWRANEHNLNFSTSGSTGTPKACSHTENLLRQEVTSLVPLFKHCSRTVVTVPIHHLYGFMFGLFLPSALNMMTCHKPGLPGVLRANLAPGDLLCTIPLLLKHLAEQGKVQGKGITIVSAGSPLNEQVFQALLNQNFKVYEIFGSSETGAVAWRCSPNQDFTLLPHLCKSTNEQQLMRLGNSELTIEPFYYNLADKIIWQGEQSFSVHGRLDNTVQVGSYNVNLSQIESVLLQHPLVQECAVRLMQSNEGWRLKAFIVPSKSFNLPMEKFSYLTDKDLASNKYDLQNISQLLDLRRELIHLARTISHHARPVHYTFGAEIIRNSMGKVQDWKI